MDIKERKFFFNLVMPNNDLIFKVFYRDLNAGLAHYNIALMKTSNFLIVLNINEIFFTAIIEFSSFCSTQLLKFDLINASSIPCSYYL